MSTQHPPKTPGMRRRDLLKAGLAAGVTLSALPLARPGMLWGAEAGQPKRGGVLRVRGFDPPNFDHHLTVAGFTQSTVSFVYSKLVRHEVGGDIPPGTFIIEPDTVFLSFARTARQSAFPLGRSTPSAWTRETAMPSKRLGAAASATRWRARRSRSSRTSHRVTSRWRLRGVTMGWRSTRWGTTAHSMLRRPRCYARRSLARKREADAEWMLIYQEL